MTNEKLDQKHILDAAKLVYMNSLEENKKVKCLPLQEEDIDKICNYLMHMVEHQIGVAVLDQEKLIGFMVGYEVDQLFAREKGVYIPVHGHGAVCENRRYIYQELYKHIAHLWVKQNIYSHAITFFAHESESVDTFFRLGFGMRCMDAILPLKDINLKKSQANTTYTIRRIKAEMASLMNPMELELVKHLNTSPVFIPVYEKPTVQRLREWLSEEGHYMWSVFDGEQPVAYMIITPEGENYITEHEAMMNICGAYTKKEYRKKGLANMVLVHILQWLKESGFKYCGVDCESLNINADRFWSKYFTPYTYSLVRRIDERINDYSS